MKTRAMALSILLVAAMLAAATTACTTDTKKGGLVPNSYASQVQKLNDTTLRITTRKMVSDDLEEINKPGTTMYNALVAVQNGASARGKGAHGVDVTICDFQFMVSKNSWNAGRLAGWNKRGQVCS